MSYRHNSSRRQGGFNGPPQHQNGASDFTGMQQSLDASIRRIKELLSEKRRFLQQADADSYRISQLEFLLEKSQKRCQELETDKVQNNEQLLKEDDSSSSESMSWGDIMDYNDEIKQKDEEILRLSELLKENGKVQTEDLGAETETLRQQNKKLQEENAMLKKEKLDLELQMKSMHANKMLTETRLREQNNKLEKQNEKLQTANKELQDTNKKLVLSETVIEHRLTLLREEKQHQELQKDNQLSILQKQKEEMEVKNRVMKENMEQALAKVREEQQLQDQKKVQEIQRLNHVNNSLSVTVSTIQDQMLLQETQHQQREEEWKNQLKHLEKLREEMECEKRDLEETIEQFLEKEEENAKEEEKKKKKYPFWRRFFPKKKHGLKVNEAAGCSI
ncbi:golgin subfamily A member 6-like protein 22 [Amphiprion ocellaris]|uniref:golgin subfamily A member 6-like protein 22 n=1 Tax=Amphiprion ocellaris TaxID=80972 RepID=UPI0024117D27|nr:golgin subfamily A member 6-like protein 22 [Amphiprion ocellaris]XP_054860809.1 golgin subfamily A member 6-like protein 22 [Amphiprion ocellaris]